MKSWWYFTSSARGTPGILPGMLLVFVIVLVWFSSTVMYTQSDGDKAFEKITDLPPWFIQPFGIVQHRDHPRFGQYSAALGDMNGDGYDDIVMLGKPNYLSEGDGNRFVIFLGAKQMQTSVGGSESSAPEKIDLQVFPNPLHVGCTDLSLSMDGLSTGSTLSITMFDALGRAQVQQDLVPSAPTLSHQISLPPLYLAFPPPPESGPSTQS